MLKALVVIGAALTVPLAPILVFAGALTGPQVQTQTVSATCAGWAGDTPASIELDAGQMDRAALIYTTALDTGSAIIHFESGDEIVRSHSWAMPGPNCIVPQTQDVIGPGGAIRFPGANEAGNLFIINGDGSQEAVPFEPTTGQDWFDRQMAHFIDCVQQGAEPMSTGERGIKALQIALAVLKAGETHELVHMGQP